MSAVKHVVATGDKNFFRHRKDLLIDIELKQVEKTVILKLSLWYSFFRIKHIESFLENHKRNHSGEELEYDRLWISTPRHLLLHDLFLLEAVAEDDYLSGEVFSLTSICIQSG